LLRDFLDLGLALVADHVHSDVDEIADHRFHVSADVPDLGELRGLDLHERRAREAGEPAGDLCLPDAGRSDEDDVVRQDLLAELVVDALPPPPVAERNGDGALGGVLTDDVFPT
jgi:hypothetical protein